MVHETPARNLHRVGSSGLATNSEYVRPNGMLLCRFPLGVSIPAGCDGHTGAAAPLDTRLPDYC